LKYLLCIFLPLSNEFCTQFLGDFDFIVELNAANDRILNEHFRTVFDKKLKEFGDRFDDAFLIDLKNEEGLEPNKNDVSDRNYRKLAKRALANLLGKSFFPNKINLFY